MASSRCPKSLGSEFFNNRSLQCKLWMYLPSPSLNLSPSLPPLFVVCEIRQIIIPYSSSLLQFHLFWKQTIWLINFYDWCTFVPSCSPSPFPSSNPFHWLALVSCKSPHNDFHPDSKSQHLWRDSRPAEVSRTVQGCASTQCIDTRTVTLKIDELRKNQAVSEEDVGWAT